MYSPGEIGAAYAGAGVASAYIERRFADELNRLLHDRQLAVLRRVMGRARPGRVLEIAPGPARLTRDVRPPGTLVCLEFNEAMIRRGRPASPQAAWVRGDAFRLPFAGGFDLAYGFRFVRHFRHDDRRRLYAELRRVLAPGGLFVMDAVNGRVSRPLREAHPGDYPIHDELYRPEGLRAELAAAGLEPLELVPVQKFHRWQYLSQVLVGPRSGRLNRLLIRGLERLPRRDGLEWVVTCRRA